MRGPKLRGAGIYGSEESPEECAWDWAAAVVVECFWKSCSVYATSSTTRGISTHGQIAGRRSPVLCEVDIALCEECVATV